MLDTFLAKHLVYNLEAQHALTQLKILHILQDFYGFCSDLLCRFRPNIVQRKRNNLLIIFFIAFKSELKERN